MKDKIVQVAITGRQDCYIIVGITESGKVVASTGDRIWCDISPIQEEKVTPDAGKE